MKQDDFDIPEVFRRAMEEAGWRGEGDDGGRRPPRRALPPPQRSPRVYRLVILSVLILLFLFSLGSIAGFYTDFLWFDALGYRDMFVKRLAVRAAVFAVAFVVAAAVLLGNWLLARRAMLREATPLQPGPLRGGWRWPFCSPRPPPASGKSCCCGSTPPPSTGPTPSSATTSASTSSACRCWSSSRAGSSPCSS